MRPACEGCPFREEDDPLIGCSPSEEQISNLQNNDSLRTVALCERQHVQELLTDKLSLLPNREAFEEALARQFYPKNRRGDVQNNPRKVLGLFIDGKKFKTINDTFGHDVGDEAIRALGFKITESLSGVLRAEDLVARRSGDEFIGALFDVDEEHVPVITQRIAESLTGISVPIPGNKFHTFGASLVGLHGVVSSSEEVLALIDQADHELNSIKDEENKKLGSRVLAALKILRNGAPRRS